MLQPEWSRPKSTTPDPSEEGYYGSSTSTTSRETEETTRPTRPVHKPTHPVTTTSTRPTTTTTAPVPPANEVEEIDDEIKCKERDFMPSKDCHFVRDFFFIFRLIINIFFFFFKLNLFFLQYYRCVYGKPLKYQCHDPLIYNPEKSICDWPENVDRPECK